MNNLGWSDNVSAAELAQKVKKDELVINVKDFGAKGDGVTDDTIAIQSAVDAVNGGSSLVGQTGLKAINSVYFPAGDYIINGTITISDTISGGITLFGLGGVRDTRMGARLLTNVSGAVFLCQKYGVAFQNISFHHNGTAKAAGTVAIEMNKTANADDAEMDIVGCTIDNYETGVKHEGRSLKVTDGSIVRCTYGVSLSWTDTGEYTAKPTHTDVDFGFRAFDISGMRFHFCDYAVYNHGRLNNDRIRGVVISNNLLDLDTFLFYGGLNHAVIEGNAADIEGSTLDVAKVHITSGGQNISIIGNTLSGYVASGTENTPTRKGKMGICFDVEAKGCTIVGNNLSGFLDSAIKFKSGATGLTLVGNSLRDNNVALTLDGTFNNSNIVNNAYSLNGTNNGGLPVFGADSRFDGQSLVPIANSKWFSLVGSGGTELGSISWDGAGTNGVTINSPSGSVNFNPSNGSVRPYTDNAVTLGSSSRFWSQTYSGGYVMKPVTSASAVNNSTFIDSADNKLKFKDSTGVVKIITLT